MKSAQILLGSIDVNTPGITVESTNLIVHPKYNPDNINNDIGLIGLKQSIKESGDFFSKTFLKLR